MPPHFEHFRFSNDGHQKTESRTAGRIAGVRHTFQHALHPEPVCRMNSRGFTRVQHYDVAPDTAEHGRYELRRLRSGHDSNSAAEVNNVPGRLLYTEDTLEFWSMVRCGGGF